MLELYDLLVAIEKYLINTQTEWIQQNILTVHKYALSAGFLKNLLSYCNRIMASHPDIIFKSNDIACLPKETLVTLLKNPDLDMNDDDIWMSVVQWAVKQSPGLENNPDDWSADDINTIKDIVADCIPFIRFFNISLKSIVLYNDLLPRKLCRDVMNYHADGKCISIDSLIINEQQVKWISSKIVESTEQLQKKQRTSRKQNHVYKFNLLYRQSRDGNTVAKFRELCNNKGPTIAVGKVSDTEEILGGYNPISWGLNEHGNYFIDTKESFVFALKKDSLEESIVSFIFNTQFAVWDNEGWFPVFGYDFGVFGEDLHFGDGNGGKRSPSAKKAAYKVPIRHLSGCFKWTDWEMFSVSLI